MIQYIPSTWSVCYITVIIYTLIFSFGLQSRFITKDNNSNWIDLLVAYSPNKNLLCKYHGVLFTIIAVVIIYSVELILLHFKYDLFFGAFLQPFSYRSSIDRLSYLSLALLYDAIFYSALMVLWFFITNKLKKYNVISTLYFSFAVITIIGVITALEYKVLSYFSDTINLTIIKNLGGGSLSEAFLYACDEIALFGLGLIVSITCFVFIVRLIKKSNFIKQCLQNEEHSSPSKIKLPIIVGSILTIACTYTISNYDHLVYGLNKKISYKIISQSLNKITDIDFDGYGSISPPLDRAPFDANIFPGALDIPGNGIDEDGLLGDAIIEQFEDDFKKTKPSAGKNIVLIVLESARFDILDKQINNQYVAPNIRNLATEGTSIECAYTHTGYTTSSIKAMFNRTIAAGFHQNTLMQLLSDSGYKRSFFSAQDESFGNVANEVGMLDGASYYFDARVAIEDRLFRSKEAGSLRLSEERVVDELRSNIDDIDFSTPQFIYLNIQAAHFWYSHPEMRKIFVSDFIPRSDITVENIEWLHNTYWNAIANADWAVGEIITLLKNKGVYDNSIVAIISDHGESLFDDGTLGHGHAVNEVQTRIPLIINDPTISANQAIGQTDIAEMLVNSAFEIDNSWNKPDKPVFQIVGGLSKPVQIAHVSFCEERTIYDFRTNSLFFSDIKKWVSFEKAMEDNTYRERATNLIREWEKLRFDQYNATKKSQPFTPKN